MALARRLTFWRETVAGTYPSPANNPMHIRLTGDDAYRLDREPQFADIRSADTTNRLIDIESTRSVIRGKVSTLLYPEQADAWMSWATSLDAAGELPSNSARYFDGLAYFEDRGLYLEQLTLSADSESDEGIWKVEADLVGLIRGTAPTIATHPVIAQSAYPATNPYKLSETTGGFILVDSGSTARTRYNSLKLTIKNMLSVNFDEQEWPSDITWHGRDVTLEASIRYLNATERGWFEGRTNIRSSIVMAKGTTPSLRTLTLNCLTRNRITGLDRAQPLGGPMYNQITLRSTIEPSSGNDFSYTFTTA